LSGVPLLEMVLVVLAAGRMVQVVHCGERETAHLGLYPMVLDYLLKGYLPRQSPVALVPPDSSSSVSVYLSSSEPPNSSSSYH